MPFCAHCGSQIPDNAAFCGACGKSTSAVPPMPPPPMAPPPGAFPTANPGLADNVAGMLAYITIIPAIVFLAVEPYSRKPFVRFHAFQSIFLFVAWTALWIVFTFVLGPIMWVFAHLLLSLLGLGMLVLCIVLMFKAYQGQMMKVPVIGDMASKQAGAI